MPNGTINVIGTVGVTKVNGPVLRSASGLINHDVAVPAAKVGQLTTRTSASVGTLTMESGHGITTGMKIDIYWVEAGVEGRRKTVTVGTVSGLFVPFTVGSGDNLPTNLTAVTTSPLVKLDTDFDGDLLEMLAAQIGARGRLVFIVSGGTEQVSVDLNDNEPYYWYSGSNITNPLVGVTVDEIGVTQAGILDETLRFGALYDSEE